MKQLLATFAVLLLSLPLFANGQKEVPPVIPLESQPTAFLAPTNPDATVKALTLPFAPQAAGGQVLKAWTFTVFDASGRLVWSQAQTETRDRGFFGELFNLGDRPKVDVPAQVVWDGTYLVDADSPLAAENGKNVPSGVYTYVLTVTDSKGLTTRTPPFTLAVQNAPVRVTKLAVDYAIFSPRGKRSVLVVHQAGSREQRWEGSFADNKGNVVRTLVWENPTDQVSADVSPPDFEWDGKDDQGQIVPEGEYRYTLKGINRAGASASRPLETAVVISERPGVLRLTSDQTVFSPQADKNWPSVLTLKLDSGNAEGLVDWTVTLTDPDHPKVALWTRTGKAPLPDSVTFDGKDQLGRPLSEGRYLALLTANFNNGNAGESPAWPFEIDTTPPRGAFNAVATVFGGTSRPNLPAEFVGDGNVDWIVDLLGPDGVKTGNSFTGQGGKMFAEVQGVDGNGKPRPDGTYTLRATAHDKAGNLGTAELAVTKDSRSMKVSLSSTSPILVPGNSSNGTLTVSPALEVADSVVGAQWTLAPVDAKGAVGAALDQKRSPDVNPYEWSGRDAAGKALADGTYRVSLSVSYANGTTSTAQRDLQINSNYLKEPQGSLSVSAPLFGGNERPTVSVTFLGDSGPDWTLELVSAGKVVAKYPIGKSGTASLDLPNGTEGALPDGTYTLRATAQSTAGVTGTVTQTVRKDSRAQKVALDLSRPVLVPGKGANGQVRITPLLDVLDSVVSTNVEVRTAGGDVVASQSRDGLVTFWDWNGKDGAGKAPADGAYTVALTVAYANGGVSRANANLQVDSTFLTEPQGSLAVNFPVFGSTQRPGVTATFSGDTGLTWTLEVLDKNGKTVKSAPLPEPFPVNVDIGTDAAGKALADGAYTLKASAKSKAGLSGTVTVGVRKDSRPLKVALDLSTPVLVPGNSLNGSVKITPVLDVLDSIDTTTLAFAAPGGAVLDTRTGDGLVPFWDWDGKDPLGKAQPDGDYKLTLTVAYDNGALSTATASLKIDSTFLKEPQGALTASVPVFGGPGRTGVTVGFTGDAGVAWNLEILGADGKTVFRAPLGTTGQASLNFQGLDDKGQTLPDGPYTLRATAVSKAGVTGNAVLQLRKDSRQAKASLDFSRTVLVPGKGANGTVRITPILEAVDSVDKTVLSVLGPDGKTVGEKTAAGPLPFWDWSGQNAQGRALANGTYEVALTVNYANGSVSRASGQVKIDSTYLNDQGPAVEMTLSSKTFAPNNVDGATDLTITLKTTEGLVPVDNWQLAVIDPRGKTFRQWTGKGLPPKSIYWDGKGDNGDVVESGDDYQLQLKVADTQNNVTRKQATVTIDIAVVKIAEGKYKIVVSSIQFPGNSSDLFKLPQEQLDKNLYVLKRLANALGKFPGYKIRLEGYAVSEFWNDPKAAAKEQTTQLIPLSLDRANSVKSVMVLLGIDTERFTVLGLGGDKPVVPHGDLENRWKNRRVEFYLDKT